MSSSGNSENRKKIILYDLKKKQVVNDGKTLMEDGTSDI